MTRPGLEPTIYHTRDEHANLYATDAVTDILENILSIYKKWCLLHNKYCCEFSYIFVNLLMVWVFQNSIHNYLMSSLVLGSNHKALYHLLVRPTTSLLLQLYLLQSLPWLLPVKLKKSHIKQNFWSVIQLDTPVMPWLFICILYIVITVLKKKLIKYIEGDKECTPFSS